MRNKLQCGDKLTFATKYIFGVGGSAILILRRKALYWDVRLRQNPPLEAFVTGDYRAYRHGNGPFSPSRRFAILQEG